MHRRDLLKAGIGVLGFGGLGGCTSNRPSDPNGGAGTRSTPTESPTPTETPVPFPETCGPLPDIDGLPSPPSEVTADTAETFVGDFERVYAVATNDEYGGVESLQIHSVETAGSRYIVGLTFDAVPAAPTPGADGTTSTALPPDAYTHRAVYRLADERMVRELRSHIDDSLLSRTCWTLESG